MKRHKTVIIGVTGGFRSGKSTAAGMFERLGAVVIDADKIAHDIILPGKGVYKKIISLFGRDILNKNKTIDRKRLGRAVFNNRKKLSLLNSVIHPEVIKRIRETLNKKRSCGGVFVIDAPLLIEAGLLDMIDRLVVVTIKRKIQIKRLKDTGLTRLDVIKRIRSQMPLSKKRRLADFIIDNNGSLNSTRKEVEKIWKEIERWQRKP